MHLSWQHGTSSADADDKMNMIAPERVGPLVSEASSYEVLEVRSTRSTKYYHSFFYYYSCIGSFREFNPASSIEFPKER